MNGSSELDPCSSVVGRQPLSRGKKRRHDHRQVAIIAAVEDRIALAKASSLIARPTIDQSGRALTTSPTSRWSPARALVLVARCDQAVVPAFRRSFAPTSRSTACRGTPSDGLPSDSSGCTRPLRCRRLVAGRAPAASQLAHAIARLGSDPRAANGDGRARAG